MLASRIQNSQSNACSVSRTLPLLLNATHYLTLYTEQLLQMQSYSFIVVALLVLAAHPCLGQGGPSDTGSSPEEESPSPAPDVACKLPMMLRARV